MRYSFKPASGLNVDQTRYLGWLVYNANDQCVGPIHHSMEQASAYMKALPDYEPPKNPSSSFKAHKRGG